MLSCMTDNEIIDLSHNSTIQSHASVRWPYPQFIFFLAVLVSKKKSFYQCSEAKKVFNSELGSNCSSLPGFCNLTPNR